MDQAWRACAKFLIVDDQEMNISLLNRILRRAGFESLQNTTNPGQFMEMFRKVKPDIILLDLHMPEIDGFSLLKQLAEQIDAREFLPIVVLTADVTSEAKTEVLHLGAHDFITKPLDKMEVVLRIDNLLKTRYFHLQLQEQNHKLEERIYERTIELEQAKHEILELLARTSEYRDDETGQHTQRVGKLAFEIAEELGLSAEEALLIRQATPLHDIGKIGIPDNILLKPGRFTPEEMEEMKRHTSIGASILEGSVFPALQLAGTIAETHHEKWNGMGYPQGLKQEEIPLAGRIVALADFYDALTNERPYKRAWTQEEALAEIENQRGQHFDPQVVVAFMNIMARRKLDNHSAS